jgi:Spy/CpxP family protein refolding chaperone
MKRHLMFFTILALLVFGFATVYAQPGTGMKARGMDRDSFPALSKDQIQQMDQLRFEHQKAMIPLRSDLKLQRVELRNMIENNTSQADLNAKLDQIGQLRTKISKERIDHMLKMKNVLTDEQREFIKSHRGMGRGFFDGWGQHKGHQGRMFDRMHRGDGMRGFRGDFDEEDDDFGMTGQGFMGMQRGWNQDCPGPCMQ